MLEFPPKADARSSAEDDLNIGNGLLRSGLVPRSKIAVEVVVMLDGVLDGVLDGHARQDSTWDSLAEMDRKIYV